MDLAVPQFPFPFRISDISKWLSGSALEQKNSCAHLLEFESAVLHGGLEIADFVIDLVKSIRRTGIIGFPEAVIDRQFGNRRNDVGLAEFCGDLAEVIMQGPDKSPLELHFLDDFAFVRRHLIGIILGDASEHFLHDLEAVSGGIEIQRHQRPEFLVQDVLFLLRHFDFLLLVMPCIHSMLAC